jgi:predicted CoA-binding protein
VDRRDRRVPHSGSHGSNTVYKRLRDRGYEVFAVNPNAEELEGDGCYQDLRAIPGGVEAVVIAMKPERELSLLLRATDHHVAAKAEEWSEYVKAA